MIYQAEHCWLKVEFNLIFDWLFSLSLNLIWILHLISYAAASAQCNSVYDITRQTWHMQRSTWLSVICIIDAIPCASSQSISRQYQVNKRTPDITEFQRLMNVDNRASGATPGYACIRLSRVGCYSTRKSIGYWSLIWAAIKKVVMSFII